MARNCNQGQNKNRVRPPGRTLPKTTYDSDMYNRAFPVGNALFLFAGGMMSLFRLPCGKLPLSFLARSFDRPTVANSGEKIKVPIFIRRKGADAFRPALAAGGLLMAYKCLSLCDFFIVQHFFKLCHIRLVLLEDF